MINEPATLALFWLAANHRALAQLAPLLMKNPLLRILLLGSLWLLTLAPALAQGPDNLAAVRLALRNGSSRELSQYFASTVEVGFDGDKQGYSATQAEFVMKNFFSKTAPASFEYLHTGASNEGIPYAIGRYSGKAGTYRVFIKLKTSKAPPLIDTLDFTKE